ncbi:cysteine desulfurase family protein [Azospirillum sp. TSO22-1]|uniref:cysteine desulfurase family protein n=1 Tax=Azospirillum sp. TSO22-1 TaxID=716789 RepID=UPI000D62258D|nr:cysteine desulfurase family protein [Azospirillum sp. TSO22-1]PWC31851.1 cysteine desulfurase [Azospirillum sp. TSO22-1]
MPDVIYLDHLASTPLDPAVLEAMLPWLAHAANPHARHRPGWAAAAAIDAARAEVAVLVGARPGEVVFTSGATEANNLALLGARPEDGRVLASAVEHPSVLDCVDGRLPVDRRGVVDLNRLEAALRAGPALVSVMAANNEIGTLQPLAGIAALCRAHGALFHCDAAQWPVPMDGIDLLSLSGHKLYGPQGIGALVVRDGVALRPLMRGGHQQNGRRAGTLPTALCVGLGEACRLARLRRDEDTRRIAALRDRLFQKLSGRLDVRRTSPAEGCLPGCLNIVVPGVDAADLLLDLADVALSTGSACSTDRTGPSHVLLALGLTPEDAHASFRFGLGRTTTDAEIDEAAERFAAAVTAARRGSSP